LCLRALRAWIDLVPRSKVLGFGGDYCVVEKVYGQLVLARENIATVLAERIAGGGMTRTQASTWVRALLWDNPREVYRLT